MSFKNASAQFNDNFQMFVHDPEKYNLYSGLGNVAKNLDQLESRLETRISDIEHQLYQILSTLNSR